jgi:hypothetical protein
MNTQNTVELGALAATEIEQVGLLGMERNEEVLEVEEKLNDVPKQLINPYPDQTPRAIVTRWYLLATRTMTNANTFDLHPVELLLAVPAVKAALSSFRYFRSDWEVKFKFTSVPQQYGLLFLSHMPNYSPTVRIGTSTILDHNCLVMDFSTQQEIIMTCSYMARHHFWDLQSYYIDIAETQVTNMDLITGVYTDVRRTDTSVSADIKLEMWMRFVNPVTAGHITWSENLPPESVEAESQSFCSAAKAMSEAGIISPERSAAVCGSEMAFAAASQFASGAKKAYDSYFTANNTGPSNLGRNQATPTVPRVWGELTHNRPDMVDNLIGNYAESSDGRYGDDQRYHTISALLAKPSVCWTQIVAVGTTTSQQIDYVSPEGSTAITDGVLGTRTAWMSQFFRMWRGSIGYLFLFASTPFFTGRWLITVDYSLNFDNTTAGDIISHEVNVRGTTWLNLMVPFLSDQPWSQLNEPGAAGSGARYPIIRLQQIEAPRPNGDTAPVTFVYVWKYGGPDLGFSSLKAAAPINLDHTVLKAESQSFVNSMAVDPLILGDGLSVPSFVGKADVVNYESILERFSYRSPAIGPVCAPVSAGTTANTNSTRGNFDLASSLFMFSSGSVRFRGNIDTGDDDNPAIYLDGGITTLTAGRGIGAGSCPEQGIVVIDKGLNPVVSFEVPFVSPYEVVILPGFADGFLKGNFQYQAVVWTGSVVPTFTKLFVSAGSTFRLYYDYPPIAYSLWPHQFTAMLEGESAKVSKKRKKQKNLSLAGPDLVNRQKKLREVTWGGVSVRALSEER